MNPTCPHVSEPLAIGSLDTTMSSVASYDPAHCVICRLIAPIYTPMGGQDSQ